MKSVVQLSITLTLCAVFAVSAVAKQQVAIPDPSNTQLTAFDQAQRAMKLALEENDLKTATLEAEKAVELGLGIYGPDHKNTVMLNYNLASILSNRYGREVRAKSHGLLVALKPDFDSIYGERSQEHVELYFLLGNTANSRETSKKYYEQTLVIAERHKAENEIKHAITQVEVGYKLLGLGSRKSAVIAEGYQYLVDNLAQDSRAVVDASLSMVRYHYAKRQFKKVIALSNELLSSFETMSFTHPYELALRSILVDVFERQNQSSKATEHCLAIGKMKPWDDNQKQTPLFRVKPEYPKSYARDRREGWVKLDFSITPTGTVKDVEVISSEGGEAFETAALKALKKWRYAPKFEAGKAVSSQHKVQLDFYLSRRD